MTTHLGLQRILLPTAQVSSLTTGSITLPSARGAFTTGNFESISTYTVGSTSVSSFDFTNIPQTYKHLQIRSVQRTANSNIGAAGLLRFNSDSGSNYWYSSLNRNTAEGQTNSTGLYLFNCASAGQDGVTMTYQFGTSVVDILDYTNVNKRKSVQSFHGKSVYEFTNTGEITITSGLWYNTSAITSITIYSGSGNFTQYSSWALYGIG